MIELKQEPIRLPNLSVVMQTVSWGHPESVVLRHSGYQVSRQIGGARRATGRCRYKQDSPKPLAHLAFVPADTVVPLEMSGGEATFLTCEFDRGYFERLISMNEWTDELTAALVNTRNEFLENLLDRLARELMGSKPPEARVLEALTTLIGIEAAETIRRTNSALRPSKVSFAEIESLCRAIDAAPNGREFRLESLAERFAVSPRHLSRRFKAATGYSILGYMQRARIEHAKRMLTETELSLKEIAHILGFSGASHLSAEFRRQVGYPPSQHRLRKRAD